MSDVERWITDNDRIRARTAHDLAGLREAVRPLRHSSPRRVLDIGCGFGGLSKLVGESIGADEIHGVDIDPEVLDEARSKGVDAVLVKAEDGVLPYPDGYFDVIMTLGIMDQMPTFDAFLREINRVLAPGGHVLVSLPNLASWHNRIMLLLGYQPRDVEISSEVLVGVPAGYAGELPDGHIHIPTLRAFTELMEHHGFASVQLSRGRPIMRPIHPALRLVDSVLTRRVSLARRFYYLGSKLPIGPAADETALLSPNPS
ncbi:MAG: class I SAM-dependent methyltransferase [Mycobacteriales bacterium]